MGRLGQPRRRSGAEPQPTFPMSVLGFRYRSNTLRHGRAVQRKYFAMALLGIEPQEGELPIIPLQNLTAGSDFHHKDAVGRQMPAGIGQYAADEVHAVAAARMSDDRLGRILPWESRDRRVADIRRVGDDQVVFPLAELLEEVGLDQRNAIL